MTDMYIHLLIICFVSWLLILKWRRRHFDQLYEQLKISAPRLPIIGHLYLFFCNGEGVLRNFHLLGKEAMNSGGVTSMWLGNKLYIHISDSEVADVVLKTCLEKDDMMKCFHIASGDGSIFASVKTWRPRRKWLAPIFNVKNLNHFVETFSKQSNILVKNIKKEVVETKNYSMGKIYMLYSLSAIFESLGIPINAQTNKEHILLTSIEKVFTAVAYRLFQPWQHHDFVYNLLPQCHKIKKHIIFIHQFISKIVRENRQKIKDSHYSLISETTARNSLIPFIDLMIKSSSNLSDVAIREESLVLITAASDTSSVGIGYVTVMLARHPDVQEKVYRELKEITGEIDRPITPEDLPHLKYLEAVVKETLRLYPPVPLIVRKIDKKIKLSSGVTLIPGCGAIINVYAINHNPTYWGKDADEFRPERFLDSAPRHPAAFATFSVGPRNCLGYQYALMSLKTVVATLLTKYRLTPAPDDKLEPLRLKFDIMMRDINDYRVRFEDRKQL